MKRDFNLLYIIMINPSNFTNNGRVFLVTSFTGLLCLTEYMVVIGEIFSAVRVKASINSNNSIFKNFDSLNSSLCVYILYK